VYIPFLMGSLSFMLGAILNYRQQSKVFNHGLHLLVSTLYTLIVTQISYFN
jgi:polypyrimidine tract-binding protein 2